MNQNLQKIALFLERDESLSAEEKASLTKAVTDTEKELEITAFKLDRTEKVKRTTAILLEETIEELEQKRKAVEAQKRELEIEFSLERVRTQAMSMNKPNDLMDICQIVYAELQLLGFHELRNAMINIYEDDKTYFLNYDYAPGSDKTVTRMPYNFHPLIEKQVRETKNADDAFNEFSFSDKELKDFRELRKANGELDDPKLDDSSSLHYYFYSIGTGSIGISTYSPITEDKLDLLKRFRNVFNLAYQRYIDITKAEAQAREAQIEAALERVRSRTMAMQKSEELPDTSYLVFQQFETLGIKAEQFSIGIMNEEEEVGEMYATIFGDKLLQLRKISIHEPIAFKKVYTAWKQKKKNLFIEITGEELQKYNIYRNKLIGRKFFPEKINSGDRWIILCAFFTNGLLSFAGTEEPSPEIMPLLERFTKVFEQTYTRFNDLKQAEAQAREAQIQLALERVRARTMAMQKGDELADVALVLFHQVKQLGIETWTTGFNIWLEGNTSYIDWVVSTNEGRFLAPYTVDLTVHPFFMEISKARKRGDDFFVIGAEGETLAEHYRLLFEMAKIQFEDLLNAGFQLPKHQINHYVFGKQVSLMFITFEPCPEAYDIFKRLGKVFEQTYTRFLDLQKAEAQAREAQIEAALEKVRSRTMAMQKSEELAETASILFQQVKKLGVESISCGFNFWNKGERECTSWMSSIDGGIMPPIQIPLTEDPNFIRFYESMQKGETFYELEMAGESLQMHHRFLRSFPAIDETFKKIELAGIPSPEKQIHNIVNFTHGNLMFITLEPCPEAHDIFIRFEKVFDKT